MSDTFHDKTRNAFDQVFASAYVNASEKDSPRQRYAYIVGMYETIILGLIKNQTDFDYVIKNVERAKKVLDKNAANSMG